MAHPTPDMEPNEELELTSVVFLPGDGGAAGLVLRLGLCLLLLWHWRMGAAAPR